MRPMTHARTVVAAALMAIAVNGVASAQVNRGQMMQMQDRMQRMDQQLQRLDRIHDRIRQMDQDMMRDMDRLRDRLHVQDPQRLSDADRMRDQDRLRQQERLHATTTAMGQMTEQVRGALMQVRAMEGDPGFERDAVMQRETERLRTHLEKMCDDLEEGARMMEQVQQRLRQSPPGT